MPRISGACFIRVDGQQLDITGAIEAPIAAVMREEIMSTAGYVGYKETPVPQTVKITAIFGPDFPLEKIRSSDAMTLTCEFGNGKIYTLSSAHLKSEGTANSESGEIDLEFVGKTGTWS